MEIGRKHPGISGKNSLRIVLGTAVILAVPLVAMQLTDEVAWSVSDFIVAGLLLLGAGFTYELIVKKLHRSKYRNAFVVALVALLVLIWLELAVGIFGTPLSGS